MLLRRGFPEKALERLERVPTDQPLGESARLLLAEAFAKAQRHDQAIETWRAYLASADAPHDHVNVALRLAEALLDRAEVRSEPAEVKPVSEDRHEDMIEALRRARSAALLAPKAAAVVERAEKLERRALAALPPKERSKLLQLSPEEQLIRVRVLLDQGASEDADDAARALVKDLKKRWGPLGCETAVLRGKALAARREWGQAADQMQKVVGSCRGDTDLRARALYLGGKYAAADNRHMHAIKLFQQLEKEAHDHRLADDARLRAALSYQRMGVEARFTELLATLPDEYPEGDMVLDGVFRLAMRRIEKSDWAGAAQVLERGARLAKAQDGERGHEFSGRERYFAARAFIETGEKKRGLDEYEGIVRELPLSYYMRHAYTRLAAEDPERARRAVSESQARAKHEPFVFERSPELERPGFARAMELLFQSEFQLAKREIEALGITQSGTKPALLWALAILYSRAGSDKDAHDIARGLLTDWLSRWPAGDWERAWRLAFPRPYHAIVSREAKKNGVPESLVYGVMREESAFDARVVSHADAYGLMQLIRPTARSFAKPVGLPFDIESLKTPRVNIALGCRVLSKLRRTFSSNRLLAIPGYNAGPGRPRRWVKERPHLDFDVWVETIPFRETRRYTKRVLASQGVYALLYEQPDVDRVVPLPMQTIP